MFRTPCKNYHEKQNQFRWQKGEKRVWVNKKKKVFYQGKEHQPNSFSDRTQKTKANIYDFQTHTYSWKKIVCNQQILLVEPIYLVLPH